MDKLPDEYKGYQVSTNTLITSDVINAIGVFLISVRDLEIRKKSEKLFEKYLDNLKSINPNEYVALNTEFLNDDLWIFMNGIAPEGYYFGSHPGDGSSYGFWEIEYYEADRLINAVLKIKEGKNEKEHNK